MVGPEATTPYKSLREAAENDFAKISLKISIQHKSYHIGVNVSWKYVQAKPNDCKHWRLYEEFRV
jgi:hypothetical protein